MPQKSDDNRTLIIAAIIGGIFAVIAALIPPLVPILFATPTADPEATIIARITQAAETATAAYNQTATHSEQYRRLPLRARL